MNVLFCFTNVHIWMPVDPVARWLQARGHSVRVLLDEDYNKKFVDQFIFAYDRAPYSMSWLKTRQDRWRRWLSAARELVNYSAYLSVRGKTSPALTERWRRYFLPQRLERLTRSGYVKKLLSSRAVWHLLRWVEPLAPPASAIVSELKEIRPDVVVAASTIYQYSKEVEYVKAARHLGIPTAVIIPSWDNLTTKGTLQIMPDRVLVWNEPQVQEAVNFHFVPRERVVCTGAPRYDPWFEMRPAMSRGEFCRQIGLDPAKPYLVYLCSSVHIGGNETGLVRDFCAALLASPEAQRHGLQIVIRPHPQNYKFFHGLDLSDPRVRVWPTDFSRIEDHERMRHDLFHTLYYGLGVTGLNTSAFLEAAIVNRPCMALAVDQYRDDQIVNPHFHHLVQGDILDVPATMGEAVTGVGAWLNGGDTRECRRRTFVQGFIRPQGLSQPAHQVMGECIENLGLPTRPGSP